MLCHPGVRRLNHFVKSNNLPYSMDDVKRITSSCRDCSEVKPQYIKPPPASLIKATQPFERLNMDFKGPLPSSSKNKYMLVIVDEFSRFPFVFPCTNMDTETVKSCLTQLFALFGKPAYVHSDRGPSFISQELINFLHKHNVACSKSTRYNPQGNGQVERYNGVVWTAIRLALKTRKLETSYWELVLPDVLHSLRSLLCTATNATPHERFF